VEVTLRPAYMLLTGLSGKLLRSANLFDSLGLIAICP
jgi:hypothetical protein